MKHTPDLFKHMTAVQDTIIKDGALSLKTKTLMMMLCDALLGHSDGVANIARRARSLGATEEEIAETVGVAFIMGGLPGLVDRSECLHAIAHGVGARHRQLRERREIVTTARLARTRRPGRWRRTVSRRLTC